MLCEVEDRKEKKKKVIHVDMLFAGTIHKVELHGGPITSSPFERPTLGVSEARKIKEREGGPSLNVFFFFF